jgi:hypothetical protein
MPSFFSAKAQHDLGRLVVLDYILTGERFNELAAHLALVDRGPAQALLRNQRDQLQQRVRQYLEVAYGIAGDSRDAVVNPMAPEDQFRSLDQTLTPLPPVGANLKSAFEALARPALQAPIPGASGLRCRGEACRGEEGMAGTGAGHRHRRRARAGRGPRYTATDSLDCRPGAARQDGRDPFCAG